MKSLLYRLISIVMLLTFILPGGIEVVHARPTQGVGAQQVFPATQSSIYLPTVSNDYIFLPPIIPETTSVLTETTIQYLDIVSGDGAVFTFTQATPALQDLTPGDVMVSPPTVATPYGFLRKVEAVSFPSGQVVVQTQSATLEDAIQQGVGQIDHTLTPAEVISSTQTKGVTLEMDSRPLRQASFHLDLNDVVLYDDDGDPGTTDDQIVANGSITFEQRFFFRPVFQGWQLEKADFTTYITETADLQIGTNVELPNVQREVEIARYTFAPLTFCIGCPLVFFPVTLYPTLSIHVGVDGSVHIGVAAGATQQATFTAGVEYANGAWNPVSRFTNDFDYDPPTLSASLNFKGYVGSELSLMLYGIAGPKAEASAYLELDANLLTTPWWVLYGGLEVGAGVDMGLLSDLIPTYEKTVIDFSAVLAQAPGGEFNFRKQLFDPPSTLSLWIQGLNPTTGDVTINGVDTQQPSTPFTWDWGDGTVEDGWFANSHTYTDRAKNYIVKVTSHYPGGGIDEAKILIRFVQSTITPIALPPNLAVAIPDHDVTLSTRLYPIPGGLTYFDDSYFVTTSRAQAEYVLSVVATLQNDYANGNIALIDNGFEQVVLRDPAAGGMYSLWYTSPPSFALGDYGFQETLQYSSFFHEMGHNFTLNSPADYYYGGKIDGNANAIFSESMANVFAHTAAFDLLNSPSTYGFDSALAFEIEQSAIASIKITRGAYEEYLSGGKVFHSWNNPTTPDDETIGTFMTIAYQFCAHAEDSGQGYRIPAKRMMALLQHFNEEWKDLYDQFNNTFEAETFRATLMVAALSYAFSTDLRAEFRDLNFPISDAIYTELIGVMTP